MPEHSAVEHWLPADGHQGLYEVSDRGRVRSLDRLVRYPDGHWQRRRGQILATTPHRTVRGYPRVTLHRNGKQKDRLVHDLVLTAFVGARPPGTEGCHWDGDTEHNDTGNLRWDTPSGNNADKLRHGTNHEKRKVGCPRSHLLKAPNLVASAIRDGHRECLACARARAAAQRARRRGEVFDFAAVADRYYAAIMVPASGVGA